MAPILNTLKGARSIYFKVASCSGALAIGIKAFGAQAVPSKKDEYSTRLALLYAVNQIHLVHSVTLLAVPLCNYPALTGALMVSGMSMVCGTGYYASIKSSEPWLGVFQLASPMGFLCLIFGWLSMCL